MGSPEIPPVFDTDFLDWFRSLTEAYWASVPVRTPDETLEDSWEWGVGCSSWQPGTRWLDGLDDEEIAKIEERRHLRFPPDYRLFLQRLHSPDRPMLSGRFVARPSLAARIVGRSEQTAAQPALARVRWDRHQDLVLMEEPSFYNWSRDRDAIDGVLAWIVDGLEFDVECNDLWAPSWGPKPGTLEEQKARLRELVEAAPKLIPIHGHRCLVGEPCVEGNAVLSVWQSDIVVYGVDLRDHLLVDFSDLLGLSDQAETELTDSIWARVHAAESVHQAIPFWGEFLSAEDPEGGRVWNPELPV